MNHATAAGVAGGRSRLDPAALTAPETLPPLEPVGEWGVLCTFQTYRPSGHDGRLLHEAWHEDSLFDVIKRAMQ